MFTFCAFSLSTEAAPKHLIFTYHGDPSTSLTVNWQELEVQVASSANASVYYDTKPQQGAIEQYAQHVSATVTKIEGLTGRTIFRAAINHLLPGTDYYITVDSAETGYSKEVKVRTIPRDDSALRFVTGGDMGIDEDARTLLRHAASYAPQFAVIGGDIAYANGNLHNAEVWDTWLNYYTEEMVSHDGYSIPAVFAIGNHEVRGSYGQAKSKAPFYFGFFGQDAEHSYFTRQFGPHFVLTVLDSGHVATHASQAVWLQEQLAKYQNVTHRAAVYHVPLYPSHRDEMDWYSREGRTYWGPLFDEYALSVAFENHDHTYKRSRLLQGGKPTTDGSGTLYLGDGCWGRGARGIDHSPREYLAQSGSIQHFWLVDVSPTAMKYQAIDLKNKVFDVYPEDSPEKIAADANFASKKPTYFIPKGMVRISKMQSLNPTWNTGETVVSVKNTFKFPVTVDLTPFFPSDVQINPHPPIKDLQLPAGETIQIALKLSTTSKTKYETEKLVFYLRVHLHANSTESQKALYFETTYGITAEETKTEK
jgi:hypothetical protein